MTVPRHQTMPEGPFDLVVVGGGINGAAIARDAVCRGHTVALLEQGDIAQSTSSASSKMIHGGIRYLEQLHIPLVYESLRERHLLTKLAPHLVEPQSFLLPVYDGRGRKPWMIRVGLWLYDKLCLGRRLGRSEMLTRDEASLRSPELETRGLLASGVYWDTVMDDARLVLANAIGAIEEGERRGVPCLVRTRTRVVGQRGSSPVNLEVEDTLLGETQTIRAHKVVYAVGPWSPKNHLRPSKGIHIVLPKLPESDGLLLQHSRDGRVFFVIPWRGKTVVGTTETPFDGDPAEVPVEADEVRYLLDELRRVFPKIAFQPDDLLGAFAGIRPLARSIGWFGARPTKLAKVSRHHRIVDEGGGVFRVFGGKYTTYRVIAKDVVDRVFGGGCPTRRLPLPGGEDGPWDEFRAKLSPEDIDDFGESEIARLWHRYGSRCLDILSLCKLEPGLRSPLAEGIPELRAEVAYSVDRELVLLPSDYLERRTSLRFSSDGALGVYDVVAEIIESRAPFAAEAIAEDRARFFAEREHERELARATLA